MAYWEWAEAFGDKVARSAPSGIECLVLIGSSVALSCSGIGMVTEAECSSILFFNFATTRR